MIDKRTDIRRGTLRIFFDMRRDHQFLLDMLNPYNPDDIHRQRRKYIQLHNQYEE